jgi:putative phosphoribosyl transferase
MFQDRDEAGQRLAEALAGRGLVNPVVLALPRGGVPVAAPVARRLGAPLGLLLVRKLGVPGHEELAAGAVGGGDPPVTVFNENVLAMIGMREAEFAEAVDAKLAEIAARRARYLGGRPEPEVAGRTVVVVDDGIATGATVKAGLMVLKARKPARVILAVPVAPRDVLGDFAGLAYEVVCLETPQPFVAVGAHYKRFPQTTDAEVVMALEAANGGG